MARNADVVEPVDDSAAGRRTRGSRGCAGPSGEAEHVVGDQVSVPVDDVAVTDARVNKRLASGKESQGEALDLGGLRAVQHVPRAVERARPGRS